MPQREVTQLDLGAQPPLPGDSAASSGVATIPKHRAVSETWATVGVHGKWRPPAQLPAGSELAASAGHQGEEGTGSTPCTPGASEAGDSEAGDDEEPCDEGEEPQDAELSGAHRWPTMPPEDAVYTEHNWAQEELRKREGENYDEARANATGFQGDGEFSWMFGNWGGTPSTKASLPRAVLQQHEERKELLKRQLQSAPAHCLCLCECDKHMEEMLQAKTRRATAEFLHTQAARNRARTQGLPWAGKDSLEGAPTNEFLVLRSSEDKGLAIAAKKAVVESIQLRFWHRSPGPSANSTRQLAKRLTDSLISSSVNSLTN